MSVEVTRLEHDADEGIEVRADSLEGLFRGAALGMLDIALDRSKLESRRVRLVHAREDELDILLVSFLSELVSMVFTDHFGPSDIMIAKLEEGQVIAEVGGQRDLPREAILTEVKEVTYHRLAVEEVDGEWRATVIFDV